MKKVLVAVCMSMAVSSYSQMGGQRQRVDREALQRQANRIDRISTNLQANVQQFLVSPRGPQRRQLKQEMLAKLERLLRVGNRMTNNIGGSPLPPGGGSGPGYPGPAQNQYMAECHIDNDYNITYGENNMGVMGGESVLSILNECKQLAQATYGSYSSAGLTNIQYSGYIPQGMQTAECHIDDDYNITMGEKVIGTLVGNTVSEIINECKQIAEGFFGSYNSSAITKLNEGVQLYGMMSAECHIDNDYNLTYGENIVGRIFGNSAVEMTRECQSIASQIYGSYSSGGIQNIMN